MHASAHYSQGNCLKAPSTQDAYIIYAKNWILLRLGDFPLEGDRDRRGGALVAINPGGDSRLADGFDTSASLACPYVLDRNFTLNSFVYNSLQGLQ